MRLAADSSVAIAAVLADHEAHQTAEEALSRADATIAHVAVETYSVLTRLPPPLQLTAAVAAAILDARLPGPHLALDVDAHSTALTRLASAHVSGGATYDGLIALTALEHGLELVSRDRRAARTYRALGVRFEASWPHDWRRGLAARAGHPPPTDNLGHPTNYKETQQLWEYSTASRRS